MIKFNFNNSSIEEKIINEYNEDVEKIHEDLHSRANDEKEFLGWIELPTNYDKNEFSRIKKAASKIQKDSDVLVVIGITNVSYFSSFANVFKAPLDLSVVT